MKIQFYFGHFLKWIQVEMPVETKHKLNGNVMFIWRPERQRDFLYMLNFVFREKTLQLWFYKKWFCSIVNKSPITHMVIIITVTAFFLLGCKGFALQIISDNKQWFRVRKLKNFKNCIFETHLIFCLKAVIRRWVENMFIPTP